MTTQAIVPTSDIEQIQSRTMVLVKQAEQLPADITQEPEVRALQLKDLADFYKDVKKDIKDMENKRLSFTTGLNASLKQINQTFKSLAESRVKAKIILDTKIKTMQRFEKKLIDEENERIRLENAANARAAAKANEIAEKHKEPETTITPVIIPQKAIKTAPKAVNSRKKWSHEIQDLYNGEIESVLLDYLVVSGKYKELAEMAIREKIRKTEDPTTLEIEGVRIYQDQTLVSR